MSRGEELGEKWEEQWRDFGSPYTGKERREQLRSIHDAMKFVESGRYIDVELTREFVEDPVTGEPIEVLKWDYARSGDDVPWCGEEIRVGRARGDWCDRPAGAGTTHEGAGPCRIHERGLGAGTGAWIVAHGFARALEVTPWEALLWAVKLSAGKIAWMEQKLSTADVDEDLEPNGRLHWWVRESANERDKLARVSKLAIDAGVAERLVRQLELEAQLMVRAANRTFDALGMSESQRQHALAIMSQAMLELEAEQTGEVINEDRERTR
jgi:hypothetical protein